MRSKGQELFAEYTSFKLGHESDKYRLQLGAYSGTVGESNLGLSYQNGAAFTTFDNSNAVGTAVNCGVEYKGAWWYNHYCAYSNLNGLWGVKDHTGVSWKNGDGYIYPTFTEMKIRRLN
ncbi:tenascin [Elysia marginata]|uniref:Tenascin n=1 Tax=Elysia marginata TaxID=1093978 RepID=A0AAV4IGD6_9GAST|nr:tenascin [Elysia marginata]